MGKKKFTIIGGSAILVVAVVAVVAVAMTRRGGDGGTGDTSSGSASPTLQSSTKMTIESICQPTDYKDTCVKTLSAVAGNTTDPKQLVQLTYQVATDYFRQALNRSAVIREGEKDPMTRSALEICRELMEYAIDDLKSSFVQLGSVDITSVDKVIDNLKVWMSATVTYQQTCLEGFDNTTTDAGYKMKKALNITSQLTANSLAILDEISSLVDSFQLSNMQGRRRLFASANSKRVGGAAAASLATLPDFPFWDPQARRNLFKVTRAQLKANANVTVAKDGSGQYTTISDAMNAVPKNNNRTYFVIYVKQGVYKEQVNLKKGYLNVVMIGDGPTKTRIVEGKNNIDGVQTYRTATLGISGDMFIGMDFGVENTAGAAKHQAVALRVTADMAIFHNCRFDGYQDTLYTHTLRQFYRDCTISGTVDFIFGDAPVVFQNCLILVRKPMSNQQNIVTAQGRTDPRAATGIVLHNCTVSAEAVFYPARKTIQNYLGRPWKAYSRTLYLQSQIDDLISPKGWLYWDGDLFLNTCYYTEVDNRGPGSALAGRVAWKGIKKIGFPTAQSYSVESFIQGGLWIPNNLVPYIPGLLPRGVH